MYIFIFIFISFLCYLPITNHYILDIRFIFCDKRLLQFFLFQQRLINLLPDNLFIYFYFIFILIVYLPSLILFCFCWDYFILSFLALIYFLLLINFMFLFHLISDILILFFWICWHKIAPRTWSTKRILFFPSASPPSPLFRLSSLSPFLSYFI